MKVLMMAGGTGGHVIPGLAIAEALIERQHDVTWLGTKSGFEAQLIPQAGYPIEYLEIQGVRGRGLKHWLMAPIRLYKSVMQARKILKSLTPDLVIGMGGYASAPGGLAARLLGIPLIIHEQNARAGSANRLLSYFAKRILTAFPDVFDKENVVVTGNPVRASLLNSQPTDSSTEKLNILILGGSQGAQALNRHLPTLLNQLSSINIWHQTGEKNLEATQQDYKKNGLQEARVESYIDDMNKAYQWADLVICRAGAMTIFELMAMGKPSILIPYPHAIGDHQTLNANYLVENGAAVLLPEEELSSGSILSEINVMQNDPQYLQTLAHRAHALYPKNSLNAIVTECEEVFDHGG
ncbi:MAG: undecaprenyldiphospho-muramoylpentapeptide beta-N-acetylglucosaminyltransferase [Gammaproteobacteria bacterium]